MKRNIEKEVFALAEAFVISRGARTQAEVISIGLENDGFFGHGECVPYARYGESLESVQAQIEALPEDIARHEIQEALAPGAARNAYDCALWDLEAKKENKRVWELLSLQAPNPVKTAYTLSLGEPEQMEQAARKHSHRSLLKIKLGTEEDMKRLEAVRRGAPTSRIIVDANEGWSADVYTELAPHLLRLGVSLVEQPMPAGADDLLAEIERPLPVCADESCHDRTGLQKLRGKYDYINIKLDKTGGLTEALQLKEMALKEGFGIMVGCMVGSSLAMAPAMVLAQGAEVVDLDAPLFLADDRKYGLQYEQDFVHPPARELWG